jgi:hypothetical protein
LMRQVMVLDVRRRVLDPIRFLAHRRLETAKQAVRPGLR